MCPWSSSRQDREETEPVKSYHGVTRAWRGTWRPNSYAALALQYEKSRGYLEERRNRAEEEQNL